MKKSQIKNELKIPTLVEWGNYDNDLDLRDMYKLFFGKHNGDVYHYYTNMAFYSRSDELLFSTKKVFQYYIYSFVLYLVLNSEDYDAKEVFLNLLIAREKKDLGSVCGIYRIKVNIEYVDQNFKKYKLNMSLYDMVKLIEKEFNIGTIDNDLYDELPYLIKQIDKMCDK